jgi:hypothetical protein
LIYFRLIFVKKNNGPGARAVTDMGDRGLRAGSMGDVRKWQTRASAGQGMVDIFKAAFYQEKNRPGARRYRHEGQGVIIGNHGARKRQARVAAA